MTLGARRVHLLAVVAAAWTLVLLVVGGVVTSKEAGLCVPDWPLSYGSINPPRWLFAENVQWEHGHRVLGAGLGLLSIGLGIALQRADPRAWMRRLGWIALALVCVQGVIGGYFRVVLLQHRMAIVHGVIGQGIFCLFVALALATSPGWIGAPAPEAVPGARRMRRLALFAAIAIYVQVVIGAVIRHSRVGHSILHVLPHVAWGLLATGLAVAAAGAAAGRPALRGPALGLGVGALLQVFLGLGTYFANVHGVEEIIRPVYQIVPATAHQALGALVLASAVVLWLRARRLYAEPDASAGDPGPALAPAGGAA